MYYEVSYLLVVIYEQVCISENYDMKKRQILLLNLSTAFGFGLFSIF